MPTICLRVIANEHHGDYIALGRKITIHPPFTLVGEK